MDYLIIYELFVPEELRNRGIGSRMLDAAEGFAKDLGFKKTRLTARPLFESRTEQEMISWYQRRGYVLANECMDTLEKIV